MGIFISVEKTVECALIAVFFATMLLLCAKKVLGAMQSLGYSGKKLIKWYGVKNNMAGERFGLLALATLLSSAVLALCFFFISDWASAVSLLAYLVFFYLYVYADQKSALKNPVTATPRFKRLAVITWLTFAVVFYILVTLINFFDVLWAKQIFSLLT
ncbi:MAG: hypothetical protein MJ091_06820 [Clostridia bacterium]|nr:hypothetical protein [Clostridia bacterium]